MSKPLAYLISWTTYGAWLPGDSRGWVKDDTPGVQAPDSVRWHDASERLKHPPVKLDVSQRSIVEQTIREHCEIRHWHLHAVNARTNHVHVVVTAEREPENVMDQFKAWCSRRLNERAQNSQRWWTKHGSTKWINDEEYLNNAITYVLEKQ